MNKKSRGIGGFSTLIIVLFVLGLYWFVGQMAMQQQSYTYEDFIAAVENDEIQSVVIEQNKAVPTGTLELSLENGDSKFVNVSDVNEAQQILKDAGIIDIEVLDVPEDSWFLTSLLPSLLMVGALVFLFMMMNRPTGANAKAMNFGRNRAKMMNPSDKHITFANVAGLHEEKEELEEIVDFLKSPKKYVQVGARIPKGVLLSSAALRSNARDRSPPRQASAARSCFRCRSPRYPVSFRYRCDTVVLDELVLLVVPAVFDHALLDLISIRAHELQVFPLLRIGTLGLVQNVHARVVFVLRGPDAKALRNQHHKQNDHTGDQHENEVNQLEANGSDDFFRRFFHKIQYSRIRSKTEPIFFGFFV